jgi:hypothetical protein
MVSGLEKKSNTPLTGHVIIQHSPSSYITLVSRLDLVPSLGKTNTVDVIGEMDRSANLHESNVIGFCSCHCKKVDEELDFSRNHQWCFCEVSVVL